MVGWFNCCGPKVRQNTMQEGVVEESSPSHRDQERRKTEGMEVGPGTSKTFLGHAPTNLPAPPGSQLL